MAFSKPASIPCSVRNEESGNKNRGERPWDKGCLEEPEIERNPQPYQYQIKIIKHQDSMQFLVKLGQVKSSEAQAQDKSCLK